jgi:integrase
MAMAGQALLARLEAKGSSRSHVETAESHLRVHLVPFFKDKPLDRITDTDVTRLLIRLNRIGRKPKTIRNVASTLHSAFELAIRRRWITSNPCKLVDLPAVPQSPEVRFLTQDELTAVVTRGIQGSPWARVERPLYLMAAMTGLRQGELLGLRWEDLDLRALKVRVRQAYVRGEFKAPKSRRGVRGVPLSSSTLSRCLPSTPSSLRTTISSSGIPRRGTRSTVPRSASASRRLAAAPACALCASTTSGTRSVHGSPRLARCRFGHFKSGWGIATQERR